MPRFGRSAARPAAVGDLIIIAVFAYLDGLSSWWVNLFGHSHPHIKAALLDQLTAQIM